MGYSVSVAPRWNILALRRKNLHAKSQHFTDKRTWLDRLGQWCWPRKSILYGVGIASFYLLRTFQQI